MDEKQENLWKQPSMTYYTYIFHQLSKEAEMN